MQILIEFALFEFFGSGRKRVFLGFFMGCGDLKALMLGALYGLWRLRKDRVMFECL
jgi:hypothetical protein